MDEPARPTPMLRTFLADHDAPCPCCSYNLRALTGTRCPECAQELKLQVGLVEPRLAWFISGVVGIGMGLGFCVLLLAYGMYWRAAGPNPLPPLFMIIVLSGTLVGCVLLTLWLLMRRRLMPNTVEVRWGAALAVTAAALVCPIWFITAVR